MTQMRIATWNLERLQKMTPSRAIDVLTDFNADIIILTETHDNVNITAYNKISTLPMNSDANGIYYKEGEVRTQIFARHPLIRRIEVSNHLTNVAAELSTPFGNIVVLGTIIGILGNRHPSSKTDLKDFEADLKAMPAESPLLIAGDFNQTFSDNYYFTTAGRNTLNNLFAEHSITNLTTDVPENIDHIAISQEFVSGKSITISEFNTSKTLSDHKGIVVNICAM